MKKFLKILSVMLLVFVIVLVGTGYYLLKTFDINKYKNEIASLVEKEIGRKLTVRGEIGVALSFVPTIVIEDVELSNADWAKNSFMIKIKKVEVSFAIMPLLDKKIVINKISVEGSEVFLEKAKTGETNWDFSEPVSADQTSFKGEVMVFAQASVQKNEEVLEDELLKNMVIKHISLTDGFIEYFDHASNKPVRVHVNTLNFAGNGFDDNIKLDFDLLIDGQKAKGEITSGSINEFLSGEVFRVAVVAKAYEINVTASGYLKDVMGDLTYDMNVDVKNPAGNMGAPETHLQSKVVGNATQVDMDIALLELAKNKMSGKIRADISKKVPDVYASLKSDLINLQNFETKKTVFVMPEIIASAEALTMIPNDKIPYDLMKMANADIAFDIKKLVVNPGLQASNVVLRANLHSSVLNVNTLKLNFGNGEIDLTSKVDGNSKTVALKAKSKNVLIQDVHKEFIVENAADFGILKGGDFELDMNVFTGGNTYRELSERLSGHMIAIVNPSTVQTGSLVFFTSDFMSKILKVVNISQSAKNLDLNCAVIRTDFKDGKAVFPEGIAVDTKQMNLISDGKVNLTNDKIEFVLEPFAGNFKDVSITQALSSFVKIKGTISEPTIAVDNKQALQTAVGLVVASPVYLGGAVVLSGNAAPCYTALKGTAYESRYPKPEGATAKTQDAYKDTAKAVKQSIKDVKRSTKEEINNIKENSKKLLESFKGLKGKKQ